MLNGHHILQRTLQQGARRLQTYLQLKLNRRQGPTSRSEQAQVKR
jgi:hypothetical protein